MEFVFSLVERLYGKSHDPKILELTLEMCEINKTPPVSLSALPSHLISGRSMRVRTDVVDRHKPGFQIWNYGVGMNQGFTNWIDQSLSLRLIKSVLDNVLLEHGVHLDLVGTSPRQSGVLSAGI